MRDGMIFDYVLHNVLCFMVMMITLDDGFVA